MGKVHIEKDFIEWDIYNWSKALKFWETYGPQDLTGQQILDIGAKNGGLSLWSALRGANVICSDLDFPGDKSKKMHQAYGVADQIDYAKADVKNLPFSDNSFDAVMFKSVLGAVGHSGQFNKQIKACQEINRVLKPGGTMFFAENATASPLHMMLRKMFINHGSKWRYVKLKEVETLMKPFSSWQIRSFGFLGTFGRSERQKNWLGKADSIIENIVPDNWQYGFCGIATK